MSNLPELQLSHLRFQTVCLFSVSWSNDVCVCKTLSGSVIKRFNQKYTRVKNGLHLSLSSVVWHREKSLYSLGRFVHHMLNFLASFFCFSFFFQFCADKCSTFLLSCQSIYASSIFIMFRFYKKLHN